MSDNTIRICILMPGHYTDVMGGAQYQVKLLIEHLSHTGNFEIFYITRNFDRNYKPSHYHIVPIIEADNSKKPGVFNEIRCVFRILKKIAPNVIYQRVASNYTGVAAYYAKNHNCKSIWHISSDADVSPLQLKLSRKFIYRIFERKLINYGIQQIHTIIAQTKTQSNLLQKNYHRKVNAIIANFHPLPTETIKKSDKINVVWIANLKKLKQPEIFIELADQLADIKNAEFTMIGKIQGNKKWAASLRNKIANTVNLNYLGEVPQEDVNAVLARSHILVNTSLFEGFSNTFIQAWMRKVPVISLTVNPDNLLDGKFLGSCSGTYEQLMKDVRTLILDTKKRDKMGEQSRKYAIEYHSERNVEKLIRLFSNK